MGDTELSRKSSNFINGCVNCKLISFCEIKLKSDLQKHFSILEHEWDTGYVGDN